MKNFQKAVWGLYTDEDVLSSFITADKFLEDLNVQTGQYPLPY